MDELQFTPTPVVGKNFSKNSPKGKRKESDFYETPYSLTSLFLDEFKDMGKKDHILEPAMGEGAMYRVLSEKGYQWLTAYDLYLPHYPNIDFFDEKKSYDWIFTNPPYSLAHEWIRHAKTLATKGVALLLPLNYLHGQRRYEDFWQDQDYPLTDVYVFTRYAWLGDPLRDDGKFRTGMQAYAWYVWRPFPMHGAPRLHWLNNNAYVLSTPKEKEE